MSWSRRLDDPIPLLSGGSLDTLRQAGEYIAALPLKQAKAPHWQLAMYCLIEAAEGRQPLLHASVGMLRALNHGKPVPTLGPRKKRVRAYRIVR